MICSATNVIMNCTIENPEVKRRIKLINNSKVAATFMLKMDEKYKPFRIDTKCGVIAPCSHKYITITFTSQKERAYTYYLVVLILHHVNESFYAIIIYPSYRRKIIFSFNRSS